MQSQGARPEGREAGDSSRCRVQNSHRSGCAAVSAGKSAQPLAPWTLRSGVECVEDKRKASAVASEDSLIFRRCETDTADGQAQGLAECVSEPHSHLNTQPVVSDAEVRASGRTGPEPSNRNICQMQVRRRTWDSQIPPSDEMGLPCEKEKKKNASPPLPKVQTPARYYNCFVSWFPVTWSCVFPGLIYDHTLDIVSKNNWSGSGAKNA